MPQIADVIKYMEATDKADWCENVVKTANGKSCFYGHLFDMGASDAEGTRLWDWFEDNYASTYMLYPVNDGKNEFYQQDNPKDRVIEYLKNLQSGKEKTTQILMDEDYANYLKNQEQ